MTVYFDRSSVQSGAFPAILAIGDSWFWYPIASNLLAEVSAVVKPDYSNILALGYQTRSTVSFRNEMPP